MSRSRKPHPPYRSISSQMEFDHHLAVEESYAAERAGDWATAFERHRAVPMFAQSHHGAMLHVLARLNDSGPGLPPWLVTRFLTVMAHRLEGHGQPRRSSRVLQHVIPKLYPHGVPFEAMGCQHPQQVSSVIFGLDWVVRQVDVYDLGGLQELMHADGVRSGAARQAEYVAQWATAPMGGFRIADADGAVLTVEDALTGEPRELVDRGLTAQHRVGNHVLGRVVPTSEAPGLMFDWQPLPIDQRVAREVAAQPERWLDVITDRAASGALPAAFSHLDDASLTADLPQHAWASLLSHEMGALLPRHPRSMVAEALTTALRLATSPELPLQRHVIAELLLDELLDDRTLARFATAPYLVAWRALAGALPDPARRRCETALWMIDATTDDLVG